MSGINLMRLGYDATDAATRAASANVGSWLLAGTDGTALGHTGDALNVALTSPISVSTDLDGIYDVGTNPTPDSVGSIFHVRNAAPGAAQQTFRSTGGAASSDAVVAANVHGIDVNAFGMVYNGTTWDRLKGLNGALVVAPSSNGSWKVTAATIGTSESQPIATALAGRTKVLFQNISNRDMYLRDVTGVTSSNGYQVPARTEAVLEIDDGASLYAIGDAAGLSARIVELAA